MLSKTVSEYLNNLPLEQKACLEKLRSLILKSVLEAVESISYTMPTYKYKNKPLIYFGAFKKHLSLFAAGKVAIEELSNELKEFKVSAGTIQFTPQKLLPDALVQKIIESKYQTRLSYI